MRNSCEECIGPKQDPQLVKYSRDFKLADSCYQNVFTSMQLICFTVLYMSKEDGGFDFSKRNLQNFNNFMTTYNHMNISGELSSEQVEWNFKKVGFDCEHEANRFPYRAKIKMIGKKCKPNNVKIMVSTANVAIEAYLILAVYTLKYRYGFSHRMIRDWWSKCIEVGTLYSKGMTDDFVVNFIKDECDLEIVM